MAIAFLGAGSEASVGSGTGTVTPGSPSSPSTNDYWLMGLAAFSLSSVTAPTVHADWNLVGLYQPSSNFCLALWEFPYLGTPPTNNTITLPNTNGRKLSGIAAFSGVDVSAPYQVGMLPQAQGATATGALLGPFPEMTSEVLGSMPVVLAGFSTTITLTISGSGYSAGFEDTDGGTQNLFSIVSGGSLGLYYKQQLLPGLVAQKSFTTSAAASWLTQGLILLPEPTHEIVGVSRDSAGAPLASVDCYLLKNESGTLYQVDSQVSDGSGNYAFQFAESAGSYAVAFRKTGSPNRFDITDFNLTPTAI
jgi:hypothetical protein